MILVSQSEKDTRRYGRAMAKTLRGGEVLALQGELGAGKTVFIRGLCQGLKIKGRVKSPTFNIFNLYHKPFSSSASLIKTVCHLDAYRLKDKKEFLACGAEEFFNQNQVVCAIEWAEKVKSFLKGHKVIWIKFSYGRKPHQRRLTFPAFFCKLS